MDHCVPPTFLMALVATVSDGSTSSALRYHLMASGLFPASAVRLPDTVGHGSVRAKNLGFK